MSDFTIRLRTHTGADIFVPPSLSFEVLTYRASVPGGYEFAEIRVNGPKEALWTVHNWLNYKLQIFSADAGQVWGGFVHEVLVGLGGIEVGLTLEQMYNRVRVAYTHDNAAGEQVRGNTDWAQDSSSISRYGVRELQHSVSNKSGTEAAALRDRILERFKDPGRKLSFPNGTDVYATIVCRGYYDKLGWEYYEDLTGIEEYTEEGSTEIAAGWQLASSQIGFDAVSDKLHHYTAGLEVLTVGDRFAVTGSTSNNTTFEVADETDDDAQRTYAASTISFDPTDDILDSANGIEDNLTSRQMINVSGSASNDGWYFIKSILEADHMTVHPAAITTEAAGPTVTITHGNSIGLTAAPVHELPSSTVVLRSEGIILAQSFQLSESWDADNVSLMVRKVGSPSDALVVTLRADNGGGLPGVTLATATVLAADLPTIQAWVTLTFPLRPTLSASTTYWIRVERSSATSATDFYRIGINADAEREGYSSGTLKLWDGATWQDRDADMPFRLLSVVETTEQIQSMANASSHVSAIDLQLDSGVYSNQYREGDLTIRDEIEKLLEDGDSSGNQIVAKMNDERALSVYQKPGTTTVDWTIDGDGQVRNIADVRLNSGRMIAGEWVELQEVPAFSGLSPFFVMGCEFNAGSGQYLLEPEGSKSPFDYGVEQG